MRPGFEQCSGNPCHGPHLWRGGASLCSGAGAFLSPYADRFLPDYCWRNWPPRHDDTCGCPPTDFVPVEPEDLPDLRVMLGDR